MVLRMTREDEIMAGYLLKGGKMLSTSCPSCGCPLFEVKGETLCVVCAEEKKATRSRQPEYTGPKETAPPSPDSPVTCVTYPELEKTLEETLITLCARIREEDDPRCVAALMGAVSLGIEGLNALRSR